MTNRDVVHLLRRLGRPGQFFQYQEPSYNATTGRAERNIHYYRDCTVYVLGLMKAERPGGLQQQDGNKTRAAVIFQDDEPLPVAPNTLGQLRVGEETWEVSSVHPQYVGEQIAYYKMELK